MTHCRHRRRAAALVALFALAGGCVTPGGGAPREKVLAATDVGLEAADALGPGRDWWTSLDDPQLDRLVATALAREPGLAAALARVRIATEQAVAAGASRSPQAALEGSAERTRLSETYIYPPPYGGSTVWDARLGVSLGWTLDVWGRQAALVQQATQLADAAARDAEAARLLLAGAVAQAYVEYARALRYQQVAERAAAQRLALLQLTQQRVHAGLDSSVELAVAQAQARQSGVEVEQARLLQEMALHALATLTGAGAAEPLQLTEPVLDLERAPPAPQALPADLLARRPDLRAGRARIEAATAGRAAAHASFYPNIDLYGFAGFTSIGLDELLQGDSLLWRVGPAVHLPLFDAGRLRGEYRRSTAELDAAVATYNTAVLRAVREAADQATRLRSLEVQLAAQQQSLDAAEQAYRYAIQRYEAGLSSQLTVLNAETQVLAARRQRVQLLADRAGAHVALLVALGGPAAQET